MLGLHLILHLLSACESVGKTQSHRVPHKTQFILHYLHCKFQVSRRRHSEILLRCQKQRPGSKAGVLQCLGYSFVQPIFQIRRMESQATPTEATHGQRHSKEKDPWRTPEN